MITSHEVSQEDYIDPVLEAQYQRTKFITIDVRVDMEEAKRRYQYDYDNDIHGTRSGYLSFNQWLSGMELEAIQFYIDIL